jgi:glycosyltransferase involved in cell wall biosynthesis
LDALWFPFNGCSWVNFSLPATATLHDASNFVVPGYAPETQAIFLAAAQRCRALITDSSFAQCELARELNIAPDRLVPIPLGVAPPRPPVPVALDASALAPYVLYVGTPELRKGFDTLLAAMSQIAKTASDLSVVVTSTQGEWQIPAGVRAHFVGHVDDDTLAELYRSCAVLAFPSRYEGFGLPVLEAMSYGAPVVTAHSSSLPETAGDAVCYVDPDDADALADAILQVIGDRDYRNELRRRGFVRAPMFSWDKTAAQTLGVIETTLR